MFGQIAIEMPDRQVDIAEFGTLLRLLEYRVAITPVRRPSHREVNNGKEDHKPDDPPQRLEVKPSCITFYRFFWCTILAFGSLRRSRHRKLQLLIVDLREQIPEHHFINLI